MNIDTRVAQAIEQAIENGYDLTTWTARDIAIDLSTYSSEFEQEDIDVLIPHVEKWKHENTTQA